MKRITCLLLLVVLNGCHLLTASGDDTLPSLPDPSLLDEDKANAPYKEIRGGAIDALSHRDYPRLATLIAQSLLSGYKLLNNNWLESFEF